MKNCMIHNFYQQPGGEDVVFRSEVELLRHKGHEVFEYTDHNDRIERMGKISLLRQTLWSKETKKKLSELIKKSNPDIAHFHNTFPLISPAAYYAFQEAGIPVIQTLHNYRFQCPSADFYRKDTVCEDCLDKLFAWPSVIHACYRDSRIQSSIVSMMLTFHRLLNTWQKKVTMYITNTNFVKKKFVQAGFPEEKIEVKPLFISNDPGASAEKGDFFIFAGRLAPLKGIFTLLEAWKSLKNIPLKIVGMGPFESQMKKYASSHNLTNVEFLGRYQRSKLLSLIKRSVGLIYPSHGYETGCLSAVEAYACARPVIASRLGSLEEIVNDEQTGLLFEPGNPLDLASKVEWAWNHPLKMKEMGERARLEFESKYTPDYNYKRMMEIYAKALRTGDKSIG